MQNNSEVFDLIVPYQEYTLISNKLTILQEQNQSLKNTIRNLNAQLEVQKQNTFMVKQSQQKLKVLSINHIKALKMLLRYENRQNQQQITIKQSNQLLIEKQQIVQANITFLQTLREQMEQLKATSLFHLNTIQTLKNNLKQRETYAEQVTSQLQKIKIQLNEYIELSQNKCKNCIKLEQQLRQKYIQTRIMLQDDKDQQLNELRKKIKQYEQQRKKLRKQSEQSAKEIEQLSPIIEGYYDWLQNPQSKLLTTFCLTIQNYRQKLINSKQFENVLEHLEIKKKSIDKALQRQFKKILQTSILLCSLQQS